MTREELVERLISVAVLYDGLVPPRSLVNAILSEIAAAGLTVVPVEPTEEMEGAYWSAMGDDRCNPDQCLTALLSAAPDYMGTGGGK